MKIILEIDPQEIADAINFEVGEEVETAESVSAWIVDNDLNFLVIATILEGIGETYE